MVGIITDGDLRRALERDAHSWAGLKAADVMHTQPHSLSAATLAIDALEMLEEHHISQVVVLDADGGFQGFVHLHQLMDSGIR